MEYQTIKLGLTNEECRMLCGNYNANLKLIIELFRTDMTVRNDEVLLFTDDANSYIDIANFFKSLCSYLKKTKEDLDENIIRQIYHDLHSPVNEDWRSAIAGYTNSGKPIRFKTYSQFCLYQNVNTNDIAFSIGPAGTGKTFLSVLMACKALKKGDCRKIVLSRPAVEAGESLGFLPGDLKEKVDPYLMPLYDSLNEILGEEQVEKLVEKNVIEIVPLAFIRGRTFSNAFVILDEAQNTTDRQMLMFLTRIGHGTKMIINGDITQIDLNIAKCRSGLITAMEKLRDIKGIGFTEFLDSDVVRNPLIEKIIKRFNI